MNVQPHQQRVIEEKAELDGKIERLSLFIQTNPDYELIPHRHRILLLRQIIVMRNLSGILGERIQLFEERRHPMDATTEQAFPGTSDTRTMQDVSDYIKAKNLVASVEKQEEQPAEECSSTIER